MQNYRTWYDTVYDQEEGWYVNVSQMMMQKGTKNYFFINDALLNSSKQFK
jgi:hypothetical protein